MRASVEDFVAGCLTCQQIKYSTQPPAGLLQPLPVPDSVWEAVTMDFITGLPVSRGQSLIFVVVDRLTKFAHFGPLPKQFTAEKVAQLFVEIVVKLHGFPNSIVSDRDSIFLSAFWQQLFKLSGTRLCHSTAYHPQTDGQTEVVNRCLEQYLRAFTHEKPSTWVTYLDWAKFSYNSAYHVSIKMSPFQALCGRTPPVIIGYTPGTTKLQALDEILMERDQLLKDLKANLLQAQNRMRQVANRKRRDLELCPVDMVLVKLQPYRQTTVAGRRFAKLSKRYYGPFPIVEKIGAVAYRLKLPKSSQIHPVFHVSMLKPFKGTENNVNQHPLQLPGNAHGSRPVPKPTAVCAVRNVLSQGKLRKQVLIQWEGEPLENSTWEN